MHLPVNGSLQRHKVVEHAMLQVIHHTLVAPDPVGQPDGRPASTCHAQQPSIHGVYMLLA